MEKQHSVSSLRSETGASADVEKSERAEAARIIRAVWWAGRAPGPVSGRPWHMGRELSIWKRLVKLDGAELVNGAMGMLERVAPTLEAPRTLRLFYAAATTPLYEQCKAEWLKSMGPARAPTPRTKGSPMAPLSSLLDRATAF